MKERILVNLFIAFIIFPMYPLLKSFIEMDVLNNSKQFSGSFSSYIMANWEVILMMPVLSLIFILLPYNLLLFHLSKSYRLSLLQKILLFLGILVALTILFGTIVNLWMTPLWKNVLYIIAFSPLSVISASLIQRFADRGDIRLSRAI